MISNTEHGECHIPLVELVIASTCDLKLQSAACTASVGKPQDGERRSNLPILSVHDKDPVDESEVSYTRLEVELNGLMGREISRHL